MALPLQQGPFVRSLLALLAAVLAGGSIRHQPTDAVAGPMPAAPSHEVRSVALEVHGLAGSTLREVLSTHAGETFDASKLAQDRDALRSALVEQGYLEAQVSEPAVLENASGAFITFRVEQGAQFRIHEVTVEGASEKDAGVVTLAAGEVASGERIEMARKVLAERLEARGGKETSVVAVLREDASAATVDIELVVH